MCKYASVEMRKLYLKITQIIIECRGLYEAGDYIKSRHRAFHTRQNLVPEVPFHKFLSVLQSFGLNTRTNLKQRFSQIIKNTEFLHDAREHARHTRDARNASEGTQLVANEVKNIFSQHTLTVNFRARFLRFVDYIS